MANRHEDVKFEPRDVRVGPVVWFLVGLMTVLAIVMAGLWYTQMQYASASIEDVAHLPPEPRIEGIGLEQATHSVTNSDIPTSARSQRIREEQMLRDGWLDAAGRKHPPIKEAMRRILERESAR